MTRCGTPRQAPYKYSRTFSTSARVTPDGRGLALRNPRHRDAVELIAPHLAGALSPVEAAVLLGGDVPLQR